MFIELAALRLSIFGWSVILAWLCGKRAQEAYTRSPYFHTMRPLNGAALLSFAGIMAFSNIVGYFAPVMDNILFGNYHFNHPASRAVGMLGMLVCIGILVDRLAYSRRYKLQWEIGWFFFVHIMIWGRQWVAG